MRLSTILVFVEWLPGNTFWLQFVTMSTAATMGTVLIPMVRENACVTGDSLVYSVRQVLVICVYEISISLSHTCCSSKLSNSSIDDTVY